MSCSKKGEEGGNLRYKYPVERQRNRCSAIAQKAQYKRDEPVITTSNQDSKENNTYNSTYLLSKLTYSL